LKIEVILSMSKTSKGGQIFSIDMVISASIFIIVITTVIFIWYSYSLRLEENIKNEDLQIKAFQISELLIKQRGIPYEWEKESNKVKVLGLVSSDRTFSTKKLREFVKLNKSSIKEKLNIENYDFYFSLKDLNGALFQLGDENPSEAGTKPTQNAKNVINIKRMGLYGDQEVIMEFTLWK